MTLRNALWPSVIAAAGLAGLALAGSGVITTATYRLGLGMLGGAALWLAFFLFRNPPQDPREFLRAFGSYYTGTATLVFTSVVLLLSINVAVDAALKLAGRRDPRTSVQHFKKYGDRVYRAYPNLSHADVRRLLTESFARTFVYAPFVQFRERPFHGRFVHVHPAGFREADSGAPWPPSPDNLNILVFGGSTTFGYGVADDQTIPASMQRLLDKQRISRRPAVYNFGAGFYFSTQERILFEQLLLAGVRPDVVVFIDGLNDIGHPDGVGYWTATLRKMVDRREASVDFFLADPGGIVENMPIRRLIASVGPLLAPSAHAGPDAREIAATKGPLILDRIAANQRIIRAIAHELGIGAVFVWQPIAAYGYDLSRHPFHDGVSMPGSPEQREYDAIYRLMAARLAATPPPADFLDLSGIQKGRDARFYVDSVHYTPEFSEEIAWRIIEHMTRRNLLR